MTNPILKNDRMILHDAERVHIVFGNIRRK